MIAELGHRCAVDRMWALQGPSLSGAGWYAVRTGAASNELNGVVSDGMVPGDDVSRLVAWLGGVPACWLTTRQDTDLTTTLVEAGATPERTGHWCGRSLGDDLRVDEAEPIVYPEDLIDVLDACDWYVDEHDVAVRRQLFTHGVEDDSWSHWCVRREGRAVAALSAWSGAALEIVEVAVLPAFRRQGLGAALVGAAMAWGRQRGLADVVAAPSPDGAELFGSLGFAFEPVVPDLCFYLPDVRPGSA